MTGTFLLVKCRRCGAYLVAAGSVKTRRCTGCNHVNKMAKVVLVKVFSTREEALDALRYVKIPPDLREEVLCTASGAGHGRGSTSDQARVRARSFLAAARGPVREDELLRQARAAGIDEKLLLAMVERGKAEGSILERAGGVLAFR